MKAFMVNHGATAGTAINKLVQLATNSAATSAIHQKQNSLPPCPPCRRGLT